MLVLHRKSIVRAALVCLLSAALIVGIPAVFRADGAYAWGGYLEDCDFDGYDDETGAPVPWYGYDETHGDTIPGDWDGNAGSYTDKHEESLRPPAQGGNTGGTSGDNTGGTSGGNTGGTSGGNTGGTPGGDTGGTPGGNTGTTGATGTAGTTGTPDTTGKTDTTGTSKPTGKTADTTGNADTAEKTDAADTAKPTDKTADKTGRTDTAEKKTSAKVTGKELAAENDKKESGEKGGVPVALIIVGVIAVLGAGGGLVFWKRKAAQKQSAQQ
ncbi:MAG: hypothetical protein LBO81_02380 [Clostridiales Family XIII bacterium]|jgi:hypothetical protein|nr:hypothetical protein [Clostridiales Family XIII bacterium]